MKFGMNLLLWTGELNEDIVPVIENLRAMGYEGIEVPLFNLGLDYTWWGDTFKNMGMECTAVTVRTADDNPISPDANVRQRGIDQSKAALDCCAAMGATHLVGPFHSALGEFSGAGPTDDEWNWGVESMRAVAEHAGDVGVTLAIEPLNRFEIYLLNTHADAARFAREVDHPNCKIMYDSFHCNIEEKNVAGAIRDGGDMIVHVHISENDRSTPGTGNVHWDENFDTLHEIGYDGWMVVEAFGLALPELAAATKIWRRMYNSEEQLAQDALNFMRENVDQRWGR